MYLCRYLGSNEGMQMQYNEWWMMSSKIKLINCFNPPTQCYSATVPPDHTHNNSSTFYNLHVQLRTLSTVESHPSSHTSHLKFHAFHPKCHTSPLHCYALHLHCHISHPSNATRSIYTATTPICTASGPHLTLLPPTLPQLQSTLSHL